MLALAVQQSHNRALTLFAFSWQTKFRVIFCGQSPTSFLQSKQALSMLRRKYATSRANYFSQCCAESVLPPEPTISFNVAQEAMLQKKNFKSKGIRSFLRKPHAIIATNRVVTFLSSSFGAFAPLRRRKEK
eukprot:637869-Pelagomonas_calceolata.AAC.9